MDTLEQYVDHDLRVLSHSERLWIWRHRQISQYSKGVGSRQSTVPRSGRRMTRAEAAVALGIKEAVYAQLEVGDAVLTAAERRRILKASASIGEPTTGELCAVARRRSERGLVDLRRALGGISQPKVIELERAGAAPVVRYWKSIGFRLP